MLQCPNYCNAQIVPMPKLLQCLNYPNAQITPMQRLLCSNSLNAQIAPMPKLPPCSNCINPTFIVSMSQSPWQSQCSLDPRGIYLGRWAHQPPLSRCCLLWLSMIQPPWVWLIWSAQIVILVKCALSIVCVTLILGPVNTETMLKDYYQKNCPLLT